MKPSKLDSIAIEPVHIGKFTITKLEIDLMHVNHGINLKTSDYNIKARSKYTKEDVVEFFAQLDGAFLEPENETKGYWYFAQELELDGRRKFLISFCIDKYERNCAGIITIYQIKKAKKGK